MQKVYIWASVILHHRTHAATSFLVLTITSFFENSEPLKAYIELRICQLKCSIHCSIILPWFFVRWKTLNSKILVSFFDEMKTIHIIYSHGNNKNFYTFFLFLDFFNYQSKCFANIMRIEQTTLSKNGTICCSENCMASCQNSLF